VRWLLGNLEILSIEFGKLFRVLFINHISGLLSISPPGVENPCLIAQLLAMRTDINSGCTGIIVDF